MLHGSNAHGFVLFVGNLSFFFFGICLGKNILGRMRHPGTTGTGQLGEGQRALLTPLHPSIPPHLL